MKYACLVYHEEQKLLSTSDDDLARAVKGCGDWIEKLNQSHSHIFSSGLQAVRSGATVRRRNGALSVTDGPFVETKEFLAGFTIIEARDLNEAINLVSNFPASEIGSVEIRPLLEPGQELSDPVDAKILRALTLSGNL